MRTLVLVRATLRRPYPDLVRAQKQTWAARDVEGVDVLFYWGGSELALHGRDLFLPAPDDWRGMGHKTLACFEYVLSHREFDLVYRTTCAAYVDLPNLVAWSREHARPTDFYAGPGGGTQPGKPPPSYVPGCGLFLSRDLVEWMVRHRSDWNHSYHDDVAIGLLLGKRGTYAEATPRVTLANLWEPREIDTSQYHFRCKTDSSWRRGDIDLLRKVDDAFARERGELHVSWYTHTRRLKLSVRRTQATLRRRSEPVRGAAHELAVLVHPPRPQHGKRAEVDGFDRLADDPAFLSGNGLAARCRYVFGDDGLKVNEEVENDWWFCKADFLEYFFRAVAPKDRFVLFSHESGCIVDRRFARRLRSPKLVAWFAANPGFRHPKLFAFPLGIANPQRPNGDLEALRQASATSLAKERLFDASFDYRTNRLEREHCLVETRVAPERKKPFPEYLRGLRSSYFAISPRGNGVDLHRMWEALYVGTIPVVTRSLVTEQHPDLPLVVLDDWSEFGSVDFSPDLYAEVWGDWDPAAIGIDRYLERVRTRIDTLRARR